MFSNTNIIKILSDFESSLIYVYDRHNPISMIVDKSCNKDWNDKIKYLITNISIIFEEKNSYCPAKIAKSFRRILKLYNEKYYRCDDYGLLCPSEVEVHYGLNRPTLFEAESVMREFVSGCLKETDLLIDYYIQNQEIVEELNYSLPKGVLKEDIAEIINITYDEVLSDYKNCCYISAISLCGKIIETVLHSVYFDVVGKSPDDDKIGIDAIINKLKKNSYELGALRDQMSVIAKHRNKAIHGSVIIPTRDEARGVISFTKDVLVKIVSQNDPE